jgi:hypothetical protein
MHAAYFFVLLIAAFIGFGIHREFRQQLRNRHPETWARLGKPSFWNNSMQNSFAVLRFLWKKEYEAVGDPEFTRVAHALRTFNIIYLLLFGAILIASFVEIFLAATRHT